MLLRYKGDGRGESFVTGNYYAAKKIHDEMGDGYAIFDEGEDWYGYDVRFVEENFDAVAEDEDVIEVRHAV